MTDFFGFQGSSCGSKAITTGLDHDPYSAQTINFAACVIASLLNRADQFAQEAEAALEDLLAHTKDHLAAVQAVGDFNAQTNGVAQTYQPNTASPTEPDFSGVVPVAPTMPDPSAPIITPCELNGLYNKARQRITKVNRKAEHDALYSASHMGIGLANPTLLMDSKSARLENNERTVQAALEQTTQEGMWRREDFKDLTRIQADVYQSSASGAAAYLNAETGRYQARLSEVETHIKEEAERRGWSEMQLKTILEKENKELQYAVEKARLLIDTMEKADNAVSAFLSTMAQGAFAAANASVSGSGSYSGSGSTSTSYSYHGEIEQP